MIELDYICSHIMRSIHAPIRQYQKDKEWVLEHYYGDETCEDPVLCDKEYMRKLISMKNEEYPVIYMEEYPVCYSVICYETLLFILGPVNIEHQQLNFHGNSVDEYFAKLHNMKSEFGISYCDYEKFCEELLLLFYVLTGQDICYQKLNEKNYMNKELLANMNKNISALFFHYQEHGKIHNPYDRETREMDSIRKGDVNRLIQSIDETFIGEYAVLSKNALRASKNLAIVGLAISARAAIEGGIPFEESFSINDSYILQVDESNNIGEIESLVRQAKIRYANMVHSLQYTDGKNRLIEECKNLIFQKMHSKIVIQELADELHVSLEYLSALFKKQEGIRISDYIMKQKINLAENLLIYSEYTIEQIALYLGFSSQSHFGAVFKKLEGVTPKQYRTKYNKKNFFGEN